MFRYLKKYLLFFTKYLFLTIVLYFYGSNISYSLQQPDYLDILKKKAIKIQLWEKRYWRLLLHYKQTVFGIESDIDSDSFFLSEDGKSNPKKELIITIEKLFSNDPVNEQHFQCKYIARYEWLKKELKIDTSKFKQFECVKFKQWLEVIKPKSITLVFPTYDLTSAGSMFGHSLIRINSKNYESNLLLSHAFNYAALIPNDENGFQYIINGVFGGYKGVFGLYPYYLKVQEYNYYNIRDIWEYDLSFTETETLKMLYHVWELGGAYFDYYFFKENCSFQLLSLFEIARPELELQNRFFLWTIPADTIRAINSYPGLIKERKYRPSRISQLKHKISQLKGNEYDVIEKLIGEDSDKFITSINWKQLKSEQKAEFLDIAVELLTLDRYKKDSQESVKLRNTLLKKRASISLQSKETHFYPLSKPPETGHATSRFSVKKGIIKKQNFKKELPFYETELRLSFHNLEDFDQGYHENSELEFGKFSIRKYQSEKTALEKLIFVNALTLVPVDRYLLKPSWAIKIAYETEKVSDCLDCLVWKIDGGLGLSWKNLNFTVFSLAKAAVKYGEVIDNELVPGVQILSGVSSTFSQNIKCNLYWEQHKYKHVLLEDYNTAKLDLRLALNKNFAIKLSVKKIALLKEGSLSLNSFF
jgi:hypothetical protein